MTSRVRAAQCRSAGVACEEHGRTVGSLNHQFWLKDPGGVAQPLRLLLLVDQEQRDAPVVVSRRRMSPWTTTSGHSGSMAIGANGPSTSVSRCVPPRGHRFQTRCGLPVFSLTRYALGCSVVLPPRRRDLSSVASRSTRERHAEGRRNQGLVLGRRLVGRAILSGVPATQGEFVAVEDLAVRFLVLGFGEAGDGTTCATGCSASLGPFAGSQHADEVPRAGRFVDLFVWPARGPSSSLRTIASSSSRSARLEGTDCLSGSVIALPHRWPRSVEQRRGVTGSVLFLPAFVGLPSFCHAVPGGPLPRSVRG